MLPAPTLCSVSDDFSSRAWADLGRHPVSGGMLNDGGMPRSLKTYDHRLRDLVRQTRDVSLATRIGVPRSTASGWLKGPTRSTVTVDVLSMSEQELKVEVLRLQRQVEKLRAIARILFACLRALDVDLSRRRVPDGPSKATLLRAIERGRDVVRLRKSLAMIGLSVSRLHAWKRAERQVSRLGPEEAGDHEGVEKGTATGPRTCPRASPTRGPCER